MYKVSILIGALSLATNAIAQDYTTPEQYQFTLESDLVYGVAPNYTGIVDTLELDLYKPLGNTDNERPLLVLVHGGAWVGGCKNDPGSGVVALAREFVGRGYVVASVNYRLGWHKDDFVPNPAGPPTWPIEYGALYAADSIEMKRALYRAQQDVKGAIRWLKQRSALDSVCVDKVFLGGESAGGFTALAAAFMDRDEEKPYYCNAMPDAPVPAPNVLNGTTFQCILHTYATPPAALQRPDLGPVQGTLNLNGNDASVRGVANLFGGVPYDAFDLDWWQGVDTPIVYMYHQTCDGIVPFNKGRPFETMSGQCNLGSTPWHTNQPITYGSNAIKNAFDAMIDPPEYITEFAYCDPFFTDLALFECIRYGNNGSYHFLGNPALRAVNIAAFFDTIASGPTSCISTGTNEISYEIRPLIYPQPAQDHIQVQHPDLHGNVSIRLMALDGRTVLERIVKANAETIQLDIPEGITSGTYVLLLGSAASTRGLRVLIER
ncbi:MAG: alpha/beta hydrolase fold domain-containing protein [Flavobacteriales bacterium]|nr:alpha/beta hydrolase fold domain-containing protein [Flavobacteriales bacterium]HQX30105.1 alpha/beta hydrolase fold domain-containing protein [Flavobacteriales bacterium]HQX38644.1 alpha/beta hydrolase fold domain-containing protein [Flavobacteriales bacterium]HQZ92579.1 alpha/beta hydrolase fold domain-containing protein [Flavobacteriales bacterium]